VGGSLYEKKATARAEKFDDNDDQDRVQLSAVPEKKDFKRPAAPVAAVASTTMRAPGKRKKFTQEEKIAIREGINKFGVGKWSEIKTEYALILRDRTAVNIKDCYRAMKNHGEIV
jgi:hypothetical protein